MKGSDEGKQSEKPAHKCEKTGMKYLVLPSDTLDLYDILDANQARLTFKSTQSIFRALCEQLGQIKAKRFQSMWERFYQHKLDFSKNLNNMHYAESNPEVADIQYEVQETADLGTDDDDINNNDDKYE
eukprot:gene36307-biopygen1587